MVHSLSFVVVRKIESAAKRFDDTRGCMNPKQPAVQPPVGLMRSGLIFVHDIHVIHKQTRPFSGWRDSAIVTASVLQEDDEAARNRKNIKGLHR